MATIGNVFVGVTPMSKRHRATTDISGNETTIVYPPAPAPNAVRPVAGNAGNATVVGQQFRKRSTKGSGAKKTKLQKIIAQHAAVTNALTGRWQALTLYNSKPSALYLSSEYSWNLAGEQFNTLPMYCFNLTGMPLNRVNVAGANNQIGLSSVSFPAYRLYKYRALTQEYTWKYVDQVRGDYSGSSNSTGWNVEWDELAGAPPVNVQKYFVDWAKPKMVFQGADLRPVKIHIALASFAHAGAGPRRQYYDGTNVQTQDNQPDEDEIEDGLMFWDHFWSTRLNNPIHTTLKPRNYNQGPPVKIWAHESFVLGQDLSTNKDPLPLQCTVDKFIRLDKQMSIVNADRWQLFSDYIVGNQPANGFGYTSVQNNQGGVAQIAQANQFFSDYQKERYLLIWADVYDQFQNPVEGPGAYLDGVGTKWSYAPSFDINLRAKFTYND